VNRAISLLVFLALLGVAGFAIASADSDGHACVAGAAGPTSVIVALPRAGSGPDDGWFPWPAVLGGLLAAAGLVLFFAGLHRGLSDAER
jgi:hypothetical protein